MEVPASLIEFVLLGPTHDRRQLQDSPILGDVWIAFGREPGKRHDLLITPVRTQPAARVAAVIYSDLERTGSMPMAALEDMADVASLQGIVAARQRFRELLRIVVPMTQWKERWVKNGGTTAGEASVPRNRSKQLQDGNLRNARATASMAVRATGADVYQCGRRESVAAARGSSR